MPTESGSPPANIVKLQATDLAQLETLLQANALPIEDCAAQLQAFFGIFDDARLIAAGGLESAGEYALLRSIVVDAEFRSMGLAAALTAFFIAESRARGLQALYLLTETAERYFNRFGFESIARDRAPAEISETR
ncbi:MAG: GNAT family N-acetyltransferase, partial [Chromatiales bacterium]|nr:GNAT family N-acetyltransferase [Chromatiales bacterium]